jgi:hypothetical protein
MPNNAVQWIWYAYFVVGSLGGCVFLYAVIREGLKKNTLPMPRFDMPMAPRVKPVSKELKEETNEG